MIGVFVRLTVVTGSDPLRGPGEMVKSSTSVAPNHLGRDQGCRERLGPQNGQCGPGAANSLRNPAPTGAKKTVTSLAG